MHVQFINSADILKNKKIQSVGPIMVLPYVDEVQAKQAAHFAAQRANVEGILLAVYDQERIGFIKIINYAFRATTSPWFGYMAQDAFAGRAWLSLAIRAIQTKKAGLLGFNDGKWQGQLASFGVADRLWAESVYEGDFFYPSYKSHFADTELTLIARQQGRYVYEPNAVLIEVDWHKDTAPVNALDRKCYLQRASLGFDGRVTDPQLMGLFA